MRVLIATRPVDFRRGADGLAPADAIVTDKRQQFFVQLGKLLAQLSSRCQ